MEIQILIFLSGDLKKLDFNFSLRSNLKNTYFNIDYLDVIKKNNIESFIKSEISIVKGKILSLKNTNLTVEVIYIKLVLLSLKRKN